MRTTTRIPSPWAESESESLAGSRRPAGGRPRRSTHGHNPTARTGCAGAAPGPERPQGAAVPGGSHPGPPQGQRARIAAPCGRPPSPGHVTRPGSGTLNHVTLPAQADRLTRDRCQPGWPAATCPGSSGEQQQKAYGSSPALAGHCQPLLTAASRDLRHDLRAK